MSNISVEMEFVTSELQILESNFGSKYFEFEYLSIFRNKIPALLIYVCYYRFPKDPKLRAKWLATFRFEETDIMKYTRIRGKYFEDTCFYVNMI